MRKGVCHASAKAKAAHETFHPIVWKLDVFSEARDTLIALPTYYIRVARADQSSEPIKDCEVAARRSYRQNIEKLREEIVANHIKGFQQKHPGVGVIINAVGARGTHPELQN